jgi:integrase
MLSGRRYSVYGRTAAEARRKLQELAQRYRLGELPALTPPRPLTLNEWAETWLRDCAGRLRPRTVLTYRQALSPLLSLLGRTRLDRLEPLRLSHAFTSLRGQVGSRTLEQGYTYLHACLEAARKLGLLPYNPLDRVPRPRHERGERAAWGVAEARRFAQACHADGSPIARLLLFCLATGCRLSEALGCRWDDLDTAAGTLRVARHVYWVGREWREGEVKTRAARRTVPLPQLARQALTTPAPSYPYVFWAGQPPTRKQLSYAMRRLCQAAQVPPIPPYALRSVHASLLTHAGLDVAATRAHLGHARATTTLEHYARALPGDRRAAALLDGLFRL